MKNWCRQQSKAQSKHNLLQILTISSIGTSINANIRTSASASISVSISTPAKMVTSIGTLASMATSSVP